MAQKTPIVEVLEVCQTYPPPSFALLCTERIYCPPLELSPCVTLTPTPTMSATNDDVVMEGTHDNADETPEPQTIANNTITPEQ